VGRVPCDVVCAYARGMDPQLIGWAASLILVFTIGYQVWQQWSAGTSKGVSKWLFIGQLVASSGFVLYSITVGDLVFIVTNSLLLLSAVAGLTIVLLHRRWEGRA
jgi:MtN3 and saliva related transmembrane protein